MRVMHLNHTSTVSGAEHSLLTLLSVLRSRHELTLAAPEGDLAERAREMGLRTAQVRGTGASWRLHPVRTPRALSEIARAGFQVRRLSRRHRIEVIHANSVRAGLIASVARRLGGPPFVVHVRDLTGSGVAAAAVRALVTRLAAEVIVVSDFVAADWRDSGRSSRKVLKVLNPIDCELFHPDEADAGAWRSQLGIPADAPLLAVVGQITPWKRQLLALEAFAELLAEVPGAHLVIAGSVKFSEGQTGVENRAYMARLLDRRRELGLEQRVHMLGERADVASVMRAADVLLAPADGEPFGRAVGEAMASGTPAVISAHGGTAEFMRDGSDGVVVVSDDGWAAACVRALELAREPSLAELRRERACSMLSKEGHAAAVEGALLRACRRQAAP